MLWHNRSKQKLWDQLVNGSRTFVSRQRPRNNGTTAVAKNQILNKQKQTEAAKEQLEREREREREVENLVRYKPE
jgi:hypothetical protein